jgi:putative AlgH/UPF0301 family transcriptional regulator
MQSDDLRPEFNLKAGQLLVATMSPWLVLSGARGSVIFLLRHDEVFSLGVNLTARHESLEYDSFLSSNPDLDMLAARPADERFILCGGPVANGYGSPSFEEGVFKFTYKSEFVFLHNPVSSLPAARPVGDIGFAAYSSTAAGDKFRDYVTCRPEHCHVILGYTGWNPGGLANEIESGYWVPIDATQELVFGTPPSRLWDACAAIAGIDKNSQPFGPQP